MARYIYIKEIPAAYKQALKKFNRAKHRKRDRFFFGFITLIGFGAVIFSVAPYLIWQISTLPKLTGGVESIPVPQEQVLSSRSALEAHVQVVEDPDGFSYFIPTELSQEGGNTPSYFIPTKLSQEGGNTPSYFIPTNTQYNEATQSAVERPKEFMITIPKLKIKKAKVKVDSLKFDTNLSHFPGSAIPGEIGNAFITGHSVLPQFADPKNYRSIFTKLPDLEVGDDIYVELPQNTFHFTVQYSKVVDRKDLSVLLPISTTGRNLTLMTCVPPGTNIKRLVVITSLI